MWTVYCIVTNLLSCIVCFIHHEDSLDHNILKFRWLDFPELRVRVSVSSEAKRKILVQS